MDKFEKLALFLEDNHLSPKSILKYWVRKKIVDENTLEEVFRVLENDANFDAQIGWYLFAGGFVAPKYNAYPNLVGVVVMLNDDSNAAPGERGLAILPETFNGCWANQYGYTNATSYNDGKKNTLKIVSKIKETPKNMFPPFEYFANFHKIGVKKGTAFIPSCEQMKEIQKNEDKIRFALEKIGASLDGEIMTSTECSNYYAYSVNIEDGTKRAQKKINEATFCALVAF